MIALLQSLMFACLFAFLIAFEAAHAADWPQFLGPDRTGISGESGLLEKFPTTGPTVKWKVAAGPGMAAVAVADGVAYTTWNSGNNQVLIALDAATGEERWKAVLGEKYDNSMGNGPRATPAVAAGKVFAYTGEGILCAADVNTGKLLWQTDSMKVCKSQTSDYGMSSSPLVVNDKVIVHVGGDGSAVVAVNTKTGKLEWQVGSGPAGYSSPTLAEIHGVQQVVSITGNELMGIDAGQGKLLWSFPFETDYACNTANPVVVGNSVFISAGENHGCVLLDIEKNANGFTAKERWESTFTKSVMRNEWQTSIVIDGYLYGFDNVGAAGPITHLSCIELSTGQKTWQIPRFGKGNMVLADGRFWITTMEGELVLVTPNPRLYQETSRAKLFEGTRQTISIANGLGYLRDANQMICVELSKQ